MLFLLVLLACGPESDTGTSCRSGAVSDHQGIEMAFICPGRFTMGSPEDEAGHGEEEQQHEVTLTRGFYIGVNEVTREQFVHHLGFEPWNNADCGETNCMVRTLSVFEAEALANRVSEAAGIPACYLCEGEQYQISCEWDSTWENPYACPGYRLPTEAEWEYAARAGTSGAFANGGNLSETDVYNCDEDVLLDNGTLLDGIAVYCGSELYGDGIFPVTTRQANAWGLFDVHGNGEEWCADMFDWNISEETSDPWITDGENRVLRGGSWHNSPRRIRSAYRGWAGASQDWRRTFRLARSE